MGIALDKQKHARQSSLGIQPQCACHGVKGRELGARRQGGWLRRPKTWSVPPSSILRILTFSNKSLAADQERTLDRVTAVTAKEAVLRSSRAEIELDWHGDTRPLLSTINAILVEDPREAKNIAGLWLLGSLCNRDFNGALRALGVLPIAGCIKKQFRFRGPGVKA